MAYRYVRRATVNENETTDEDALAPHPDDVELPYDHTLQQYIKQSEPSISSRPEDVNQDRQHLCTRCSTINFYEINRISNATIPRGPGQVSYDDGAVHLEFQEKFFGDGAEHRGKELPDYYVPQDPFFIRAKPVFDLGMSLVTTDGGAGRCCLCKLFAFMATTYGGDDLNRSSTPRRWFLAVFKELRGDLFLVRQSASWGEDALRRGRIAVTPWWDSRNDPGRWKISPEFFRPSINYSFIIAEIETCRKQQKTRPSQPIPGMKLINCHDRRIVDATGMETYVALSYVWGPAVRSPEPFITDDGNIVEGRVARTIKDAISATIALGKTYLWIDRYCIDQVDLAIKVKQLGTMDRIFSQSWVTILALGPHDDCGLPGIRKGRKEKPSACVDDYSLAPLGPSIVTEHRNSKWKSRAWTCQEGILSPRLLSFTDSQIFITCNHGTVCEAYPQVSHQAENVWTEYYETVPIPQLLGLEPLLADKPVDDTSFEFTDALGAYCSRELTYELDALAACLGILARSGLESHFGIPLFLSSMTRSPPNLQAIATEESTIGAALGLSWHSDNIFNEPINYAPEQLDGTVCAAFPSWSWTSCRPGRKIFAHPLTQDRCRDDAILIHGAVVWSETDDGKQTVPWSVATDTSGSRKAVPSSNTIPCNTLQPTISKILNLKTTIVPFTIPVNSVVREYGRIKNIHLDWPVLRNSDFGRAEVRLYPDPRPPCQCHAHLHLPYAADATTSETIAGKAALLFIDSYATVEPRYALAYFMALRCCDEASGLMYRVGMIVVSMNAEPAMDRWGPVVGGVPHRECLPRIREGFRDAVVREWNDGVGRGRVRIR